MKKINSSIFRNILYCFLVSLILLLVLESVTATQLEEQENFKTAIVHQNLSFHNPIDIISEQNFTDYGFLGDGSSINPYRIENLNITTVEERGISIQNVTCYFN